MQPQEYMDDFLLAALEHLKKNSDNFLKKLESGDINAIKLILDFACKTHSIKKNENSDKDNLKGKSTKTEDLQYDEALKHFKEIVYKDNSEPDTERN